MTIRKRTALSVVAGLGAALLMAPRGMAAPARDPGASASPSVTAAAAGDQRQDPAPRPLSQNVTLHLRETPLRTALQMLFAGSGLQHAVELAVPNYPITLDIRDVPFSMALQILLRLAPGATYRKEGDIYLVGMRQPAPVPTSYDSEQPAPAESIASAGREQWEKIPLNFLHPAIAALVLNGQLVPTEDQIQPGSGGQGGYGSGANGLGGVGAYGSLNGGLGAGYGGAGNGYGSFGNGYSGFGNGSGSFGQGLGANVIVPGSGNSVITGPQPRRF